LNKEENVASNEKIRLRKNVIWFKYKNIMKKLFLSLMLVAFAVSVNAGEGDKAVCSKKAGCEVKAACPVACKDAEKACPAGAKQGKCSKVCSPKGSEQAKK